MKSTKPRAARSVADVRRALPQGLETRVGEGGYGLSGGQAQRVAIARAFLKNAPLLLLDEPTAHLDPATEAEVLDEPRRLAIGRTVILASHSSAAHGFAGRRLDLRDGRAVAGAWCRMNDVAADPGAVARAVAVAGCRCRHCACRVGRRCRAVGAWRRDDRLGDRSWHRWSCRSHCAALASPASCCATWSGW